MLIFGSWVFFFGFSSECQATRFLQRIFFFFCSFVYSLLMCFRGCFTLEQMSDNNQLTKKWLTQMINVSNRSVSCRKITEKVGKSFCRGNFYLCPAENLFFWPGQRRNVQRMCLQSFKAVPFSYLEFFPKEGHSTMMDRHSFSPKSFLSRPP